MVQQRESKAAEALAPTVLDQVRWRYQRERRITNDVEFVVEVPHARLAGCAAGPACRRHRKCNVRQDLGAGEALPGNHVIEVVVRIEESERFLERAGELRNLCKLPGQVVGIHQEQRDVALQNDRGGLEQGGSEDVNSIVKRFGIAHRQDLGGAGCP